MTDLASFMSDWTARLKQMAAGPELDPDTMMARELLAATEQPTSTEVQVCNADSDEHVGPFVRIRLWENLNRCQACGTELIIN